MDLDVHRGTLECICPYNLEVWRTATKRSTGSTRAVENAIVESSFMDHVVKALSSFQLIWKRDGHKGSIQLRRFGH